MHIYLDISIDTGKIGMILFALITFFVTRPQILKEEVFVLAHVLVDVWVAPKRKQHGGGEAAHLMAAKKQGVRGAAKKGDAPFQGSRVTCLFQPDCAS